MVVPRMSGDAEIRIIVLCMVPKPAAPTPDTANITKDTGYHGERANSSRLNSWSVIPKI
jgi:hypothetical protein